MEIIKITKTIFDKDINKLYNKADELIYYAEMNKYKIISWNEFFHSSYGFGMKISMEKIQG